MILKRQEKNGKVKSIYKSSNICASVYDLTTNDLTLIFNHGGQYKYGAVSKTDYMRFETADSQGSVLNTHLKKYATTKLDAVDTSEILKEVKELSEASKPTVTPEVATKEMLSAMTDIISNHFKNGNVTSASLLALKGKMTQFEDVTKKQPELVNE
jgi:hypothetical protein